MSLCKPLLWQSYFPDIPMPEGCTYWQFMACLETQWADDDLTWSAGYIHSLKKLKANPAVTAADEVFDELITNELERVKAL